MDSVTNTNTNTNSSSSSGSSWVFISSILLFILVFTALEIRKNVILFFTTSAIFFSLLLTFFSYFVMIILFTIFFFYCQVKVSAFKYQPKQKMQDQNYFFKVSSIRKHTFFFSILPLYLSIYTIFLLSLSLSLFIFPSFFLSIFRGLL